jgi:hypothetical protein
MNRQFLACRYRPAALFRLQVLKIDRVAPSQNPRQEQNRFLDVRRQMQVHDLRQARPADLPEPGQLATTHSLDSAEA